MRFMCFIVLSLGIELVETHKSHVIHMCRMFFWYKIEGTDGTTIEGYISIGVRRCRGTGFKSREVEE